MELEIEPFFELNKTRDSFRSIVLIDEIDKADPDVPNDLLEVLGMNRFHVDEIDRPVERKASALPTDSASPSRYGDLLIVITTTQSLPAGSR